MQIPPPPTQLQCHNQRIIGLDVLRVVLALFIFFFHSRIHLGCSYGLLNDFFNTAALAMSGFFMLSGYSLYIVYRNKPLLEPQEYKKFYIKRFISIYPMYFIVGLISVSMKTIVGLQTVADNVLLLPIELLGIQSIFNHSLFRYAHNGGTWFISCIIICYFVFPFIKKLIMDFAITVKKTILATFLLILILSYIRSLPSHFECGDLYTNAYLRAMEFVLGMLIAKFNLDSDANNRWLKIIRSWPVQTLTIITMIVGVSYCNHYGCHSELLMYCSLAIIFIAAGQMVSDDSRKGYKYYIYASSITYAFYLSQALVWNPAKYLLRHFGEFGNSTMIVGSLLACLLISFVLHEIVDKRIGNSLKNKFINSK